MIQRDRTFVGSYRRLDAHDDAAAAALVALALTVWMGGWASVPAVVGMGAAMLILRHWAIRRLGGITGDILGAAQVLGELGFLLGWLAWG